MNHGEESQKRRRKHKTPGRKGFTFSDSETESSDGSTEVLIDSQQAVPSRSGPLTRASSKKREKRTKQDRSEDVTSSSESEEESMYPSDVDEDEDFFTRWLERSAIKEANDRDLLYELTNFAIGLYQRKIFLNLRSTPFSISGDSDVKRSHPPIYEPCKVADVELSLPYEISTGLVDLFQIFTLDTWKGLSDQEKNSLMKFLPANEPTELLVNDLFSNKNFHFGNPVAKLQHNLKKGICHVQVAPEREKFLSALKDQHRHNLRLYHEKFIRTVIEQKQTLRLRYREDRAKQETETIENASITIPIQDEQVAAVVPELIEDDTEEPPVDADKFDDDVDTEPSDDESGFTPDFNNWPGFKKVEKDLEVEDPQQPRKIPEAPEQERKESDIAVPPVPTAKKLPVFYVFTTLRDMFLQQRVLTLRDLCRKAERTMPSQMLHYDSTLFINLAMKFLQSPPGFPKKGNLSAIVNRTESPEGPSFTWNDQNKRHLSEDYLNAIEQLFFFAISRSSANDFLPIKGLTTAQKTIKTINSTPFDQVQAYHKQEIERYTCPEQPFTFNINNMKSVVAPLKRIAHQTGNNKAREHYLLRDGRPSYVTLLTLVRDAASRLPGGVGTKADVAILLRDSQYIIQDQPEDKYREAVGGALDRLRLEEDPCVQFDNDRKLWLYLHRNRRARDFA